MRTAMTANPFAALLDGVPRYDGYGTFDPDGDVVRLSEVLAALAAAVPADLAEAGKVLEGVTPGPWTEHDKGKHPNPYVCGATEIYEHGEDKPVVAYVVGMNDAANRRFIAWCREGVPALLARLAAQEAQIKGLEAERDRVGLEEKMRMVAWCSKRQAITAKAWQRAARKALSGDMSELRNRIDLIDAGPMDIVQSDEDRAEAAETALAAERAKTAKLVEALTLAANRLSRRAVDYIPGGRLFIETSEWADEARAAITEAGQ